MIFKWNLVKEHVGSIWDCNRGRIEPFITTTATDRDMIRNPGGHEHRAILESLCRVISELVEIEEKRAKIASFHGAE
jgi:hypothetical protein